jgi:hypothetical protein
MAALEKTASAVFLRQFLHLLRGGDLQTHRIFKKSSSNLPTIAGRSSAN